MAVDPDWERRAWIVEDEPAAATLAAELCVSQGAMASVFRLPLPFLTALRSSPAPAVIVLDWRLENELGAGIFLAIRHHYPRMPVILWTASQAGALPDMIVADHYSVVVDKALGAGSFEDALAWALTDEQGPAPAV